MISLSRHLKQFGIGVFLIASFSRVLSFLHLSKLFCAYTYWKHRFLSEWLWKRFKYTVKYDKDIKHEIDDDGYVFVFWYQGEQSAPPIVKACIASIRKWCFDRKVVVLDKNNYLDYASVPTCVLCRLENGEIGMAHFSDVLRVALLREHGGFWIDATNFMLNQIPECALSYSFYSLNGVFESFKYDLGFKWTIWFFYAKKGDMIVNNLYHFLEEYWSRYNTELTYLFWDCWLLAMYNHIPQVKVKIDSLPRTDGSYCQLLNNWHLIAKGENAKMIDEGAFLNKLSYKGNLPERKIDGELTLYGKVLEMYGL
ncbi:MAG: capsular polysaccharide synthesis protein [Muribaculaceae bacterium]